MRDRGQFAPQAHHGFASKPDLDTRLDAACELAASSSRPQRRTGSETRVPLAGFRVNRSRKGCVVACRGTTLTEGAPSICAQDSWQSGQGVLDE